MKLNLPENVSSQQDLKALILEVQQYAHWFSQNSVKQKYSKVKSDEQPPELSPEANSLIKEQAKDQKAEQSSLDELIASLSDIEANAPHITITLAAAAPNSLKKELIGWFRQNVDKNILVNFKFNSTLLGGMVVNYRSHIFDWSFRRQIMATRDHFPEVLRRV